MSTAELLQIIAVVSAWARADNEAVEVLVEGAGPEMFANLLDFTTMVITHNTGGNAADYLGWLGGQALTLQAHEARADQ